LVASDFGFPTILVVGNDDGLSVLVKSLRFDGYLVLVAANFDDAISTVRIHSQQIRLPVAYGDMNANDLAVMMTPFRLGAIPVVRVSGERDAERASIEVRKLLQSPKQPGRAEI
jgi:hypothetical protein